MNMNDQLQMPPSSQAWLPQPKSKVWLWIIVAVVAVLVLALAWYYYSYTPAPSEGVGGAAGTAEDVSDISQELQDAGVEGLDTELGDIEKELAQ